MSTSRFKKEKGTDESGDVAQNLIERSKGRVAGRELVPDDATILKRTVARALRAKGLDVILLIGGTGVSNTDVTIETVRPLFEKEIEGFGELFRSVSYQKIGAAAALSRATAGIAKRRLVMCLPGSPDAVRTGLGMFLGEVPHVLHLARGL